MLNLFGWASSKGMVAVPDLSTLTYTNAITALQNAGLNYTNSGSTNTANSNLNNKIATQSVTAGTLVDYETNISFTYYTYVATPTPVPTPVAPTPTPTTPTPTASPVAPTPTPTPVAIQAWYASGCCDGVVVHGSSTVSEANALDAMDGFCTQSQIGVTNAVAAYGTSYPSVTCVSPTPTTPTPVPTTPTPVPTTPTPTSASCPGQATNPASITCAELGLIYLGNSSQYSVPQGWSCCGGAIPTPAPTPVAPTPAPTPVPTPVPVAPTPTAQSCPGQATNPASMTCAELGLVYLGNSSQYSVPSGWSCCGGAVPTPSPVAPSPAPTPSPVAPSPVAPSPVAPSPVAPSPVAPTPTPVAAYSFSTTTYGVKCISGNTFIRLSSALGTESIDPITGKITLVDSDGNIVAKQAKDIEIGDEVMTVSYAEINIDSPDYEMFVWESDSLTFIENSTTTIVDVQELNKTQTVYFNGDQTTQFTLEHPILVNKLDNGVDSWKFAMVAELEVGDIIVKYDHSTGLYNNTEITSIDILSNDDAVYTFSAEPGDIIIAGDIITHNK